MASGGGGGGHLGPEEEEEEFDAFNEDTFGGGGKSGLTNGWERGCAIIKKLGSQKIKYTRSLRYKRHLYKRQIRRLVKNTEKLRDMSL